MKKNSTASVLGCIMSCFLLVSACSPSVREIPVETVVVKNIEIKRPAPVVPNVDQLDLRSVKWIIVTPENVDSVFASLNGDMVLFALTADGYESLSLNLSDVRANIEQYKKIIAIYKAQF